MMSTTPLRYSNQARQSESRRAVYHQYAAARASRRLGYSVRQTMTLAQRLYESGQITYMRTDSTTLSGQTIKAADSTLPKFWHPVPPSASVQDQNSSAQRGSRAIRPTDFNVTAAGSDDQQRNCINSFGSAPASQMAPAALERTEVTITISDHSETFPSQRRGLKI